MGSSDGPELTRARGPIDNVARTLLARAGLAGGYRKIFVIGQNKCASSSIHEVFRRSGLHGTHSTWWRVSGLPYVHHWPYQTFSDGEPTDFRLLDRRFPGARFILNVRDLDEWLDSRFEHYRARATARGTPFAHGVEDLIDWIRRRDAHHLKVLDHFESRPSDLLVVNFIRDPNAATAITRFIGVSEQVERPHVLPIPKTRQQGVLTNASLIEEAFETLGVPKEERAFDLYCPSLADDAAQRFPTDTRLMALTRGAPMVQR